MNEEYAKLDDISDIKKHIINRYDMEMGIYGYTAPNTGLFIDFDMLEKRISFVTPKSDFGEKLLLKESQSILDVDLIYFAQSKLHFKQKYLQQFMPSTILGELYRDSQDMSQSTAGSIFIHTKIPFESLLDVSDAYIQSHLSFIRQSN